MKEYLRTRAAITRGRAVFIGRVIAAVVSIGIFVAVLWAADNQAKIVSADIVDVAGVRMVMLTYGDGKVKMVPVTVTEGPSGP